MTLIQYLRYAAMRLSLFFFISTAYAANPVWTFTPNPLTPPHLSITSQQTTAVVYTVQNHSHKAKSLVMQAIPGVEQVLPCQLAPVDKPGSSCSLILVITGNMLPAEGVHTGPILCEANANATPNPNQCYRPSAADNLAITVVKPSVGVTISVNPFILFMAENSTGTVTVTNEASSSGSAQHVTATIPGASGISIQNSTCGSSLPAGANCTITFASTTQQGPTIIPVKGDNTNTANVYAAVTSQPVISITGPAQQSRIVPTDGFTELDLEVTNDPDSLFLATNINVTDKASCPNLSVDASNCVNIAPGASCLLALTTTTPYAPCTITISGSNTANSPTTSIAFSYLGGLVFETTGIHGKVVANAASEFSSEWTFPSKSDIPGATSDTDGLSNTNAIVASPACTNQQGNCAAYLCRVLGADWYLPAANEFQTAIFTLCPNASYPCSFGSFASTSYWSSTQWFAATNAYAVDVPSGNIGPLDKWTTKHVRCIRGF